MDAEKINQDGRRAGVRIGEIARIIKEEAMSVVPDEQCAEGICQQVLFHIVCSHIEMIELVRLSHTGR